MTTASTTNDVQVHEARPEQEPPEQDHRVSEITDDVVELGTIWASFGLCAGRSALDASARTLTASARLLRHFAEALDERRSRANGSA
jgi:hypothetical protein